MINVFCEVLAVLIVSLTGAEVIIYLTREQRKA